jgi:hypothetical protein
MLVDDSTLEVRKGLAQIKGFVPAIGKFEGNILLNQPTERKVIGKVELDMSGRFPVEISLIAKEGISSAFLKGDRGMGAIHFFVEGVIVSTQTLSVKGELGVPVSVFKYLMPSVKAGRVMVHAEAELSLGESFQIKGALLMAKEVRG